MQMYMIFQSRCIDARFLTHRDIFSILRSSNVTEVVPWKGAKNPGYVNTRRLQYKPLPVPCRLSFPSPGWHEAERGLIIPHR